MACKRCEVLEEEIERLEAVVAERISRHCLDRVSPHVPETRWGAFLAARMDMIEELKGEGKSAEDIATILSFGDTEQVRRLMMRVEERHG